MKNNIILNRINNIRGKGNAGWLYKPITVILLFLLLSPPDTLAQVSHPEQDDNKGGQKFTVALGHAHIKEGIEEGKNKWLVMGAWALNYDYLLNSKWALGIHNDIIIEDFTVEKHLGNDEEKGIEREVPIASKLVGSFKPGKHMSYILGIGEEFAKRKHFFMSTVGLEYGWHLHNGWELGGELSYDIKWHAYDTWIFGVGVSKTIFPHHKKI